MVVWTFNSCSTCARSLLRRAPVAFSSWPRSPRTFSWSCLSSAIASPGFFVAPVFRAAIRFLPAREDHDACLLIRDDRARHQLAQLAENVLRRNPELAIRRGALQKILRGFFVEDARVDGAVVQLAERDQRRERDPPIAAAER